MDLPSRLMRADILIPKFESFYRRPTYGVTASASALTSTLFLRICFVLFWSHIYLLELSVDLMKDLDCQAFDFHLDCSSRRPVTCFQIVQGCLVLPPLLWTLLI
jgi:hypothetical protein